MRRPDPPGARVERLDRDERRRDADAEEARARRPTGTSAGRTGRPVPRAASQYTVAVAVMISATGAVADPLSSTSAATASRRSPDSRAASTTQTA